MGPNKPGLIFVTLLIKLGVIASLASIIARFGHFRRLIFLEERNLKQKLLFAAVLGVPFMLGVLARLLTHGYAGTQLANGYPGADLSLEGTVLASLRDARSVQDFLRPHGARAPLLSRFASSLDQVVDRAGHPDRRGPPAPHLEQHPHAAQARGAGTAADGSAHGSLSQPDQPAFPVQYAQHGLFPHPLRPGHRAHRAAEALEHPAPPAE